MMILTGKQIAKERELRRIIIDPWYPDHINPASMDLTLGNKVLIWRDPKRVTDDGYECDQGIRRVVDVKKPDSFTYEEHTIGPDGFDISPGTVYLMHTVEVVRTDCFVPVLDGKSSIGRLGVLIHMTAGFGDPGFRGQYTLEVASLGRPIRVYAGMRFCQIRFHTLIGETTNYQRCGHYVGDLAKGPCASQVWKQFGYKA